MAEHDLEFLYTFHIFLMFYLDIKRIRKLNITFNDSHPYAVITEFILI